MKKKGIVILALLFITTHANAHDPKSSLRVEDYENEAIDSKVKSINPNSKITDEQQKMLNDSLKKGKKYLQERQKFLDQGQSVNHYYKETDSAYEVITDIIHAESVGMKSLYYLQPMKAGDIESCESCSS